MSKLIGTHNGIESDSVNGAVNFTTGVQISGDPVSAIAQQAAITDLTDNTGAAPTPGSVEDGSATTTAAGVSASGDMDGADTVDEAALEAALLALETEVGLLKDDVEALATALDVVNGNISVLNDQLVTINATLAAAGVTL